LYLLEEVAKVHALLSAKEIWETLTLTHEGSKEIKKKKILTSIWEDFDSSNSNFDEGADIGCMTDVSNNSMSEDLDNEVDFINIYSLRLAYQEAISNNGIIACAYKIMKRNYKNACKEIKLMQQEKANLYDLSLKNTEFLQDCVKIIETLKGTLKLRTQISKTWKKIGIS